MITGRCNFGAILSKKTIFVCGGSEKETDLKCIEYFIISSNIWMKQKTVALPYPVSNFSFVQIKDETVFIVGGLS